LVEKKLGFELYCFQGSYNRGGVAQSGGTHDLGGAIDVSICPAGSNVNKADLIVKTLRQFGWAAWHRTPAQGDWGHHIHAVDSGDRDLSEGAARQVAEYRQGFDGLAGDGSDDGPRIALVARRYPPLPYVSLANVQAQAEKGGPRVLRGVRRIQRALLAHGDSDLVVDGRFGPKTKKAYAQFEKSVGGDGDGIPGLFSLTKLGEGRFRVRKS
jgi:hypothetical protein